MFQTRYTHKIAHRLIHLQWISSIQHVVDECVLHVLHLGIFPMKQTTVFYSWDTPATWDKFQMGCNILRCTHRPHLQTRGHKGVFFWEFLQKHAPKWLTWGQFLGRLAAAYKALVLAPPNRALVQFLRRTEHVYISASCNFPFIRFFSLSHLCISSFLDPYQSISISFHVSHSEW